MLRRIAERMWDKPQWLIGLGLVMLLLLAYYVSYNRDQDEPDIDNPQVVRLTLDERLAAYESSLRAEADWLWNNMIVTQTRPRPDEAACAPQDFGRTPVTMDAAERTEDDLGGKVLDQLDYAAQVIDQARTQWDAFCTLHASAADTVAFLNVRITGAIQRLDVAKEALDTRARSRGD